LQVINGIRSTAELQRRRLIHPAKRITNTVFQQLEKKNTVLLARNTVHCNAKVKQFPFIIKANL
jgi:hypothetical protein